MAKFKKSLLAALLLAALLLTACGEDAQVSSSDAVIVLPEPENTHTQQFFGETDKSASPEITLHYVSDDHYGLTSVTSTINVGRDERLIGRVLAELFSATSGTLPHTVASGAKLIGYEYGCGTVTVNLSIDSLLHQNEIETQLFIASISNTLLGMDGINAVNILTGDRAIDVGRLPMGVYTSPNENIPASYAQLESESERFLGDTGVSIVRSAVLYFPAENGEYILPEVREITFESEDYTAWLIDTLKQGPIAETAAISAIPENEGLFNSAPAETVTTAGERILYLDFNSMMLNYLAFAGLEEWELYGSIVLTLTSFIPEVDAVCIMIDGNLLESCTLPDKQLSIEGGLVRRSDFSGCIGSATELYFAHADGHLAKKRCALSQVAAISPKRLLESLIRTLPADTNLASVFPEGINPEDVLGVMIEDRVANINLSANFYARCQSLTAQQEKNIIYAMVNSLCELENIGAVRFYIEGRLVDTLTENIYLKTALLPDRSSADIT